MRSSYRPFPADRRPRPPMPFIAAGNRTTGGEIGQVPTRSPGGGVARGRFERRSTLAFVTALALAAVGASQLVVGAAPPQDGREGSGGTAVAHRAGGRVV